MQWFLQKENFGMGDFIMLTPGMQIISKVNGSPLRTYFETDYIAQLYLDCPFIQILKEKPENKPVWGTVFASDSPRLKGYAVHKSSNKQSLEDCYVAYVKKTLEYDGPSFDTYVDTPPPNPRLPNGKRYIAVFHGCLGDRFLMKKSVPLPCLTYWLKRCLGCGFIPVILGDRRDWKRFWRKIQIPSQAINYVNQLSIRESVGVLNQCEGFISNDTGLSHIASALKKRGVILWNATDIYKNKVSYGRITRTCSMEHRSARRQEKVYNKAVDKFLEQMT